MMLRQMVDDKGRLIDMAPKLLLIPPDLETTARELLSSNEIARDTRVTQSCHLAIAGKTSCRW